MFGFEFVQQGFLFAGLAAAVPIAIHLLLKQRARQVDIGSVRFLQLVMRQHNRMYRIRQWLLLAARIITTILLALLFARPFLDRSSLDASQREVVLLLDRSASMQMASRGGAILLDEAHQALRDYLDALHENTLVHVATFDAGQIQQVDWEEDRQSPPVGFGGTDYAKGLAWARDLLQQSGRPDQEIVIFTDLQRTGVIQSELGEFPARVRVGIRDFGKPLATNIALTRAVAVATEIRPKMPPRIEVDLRNDGPLGIDQVVVQLDLAGPDGQQQWTQNVELPAASQTQVQFELPDAVPGLYQGHVHIKNDDELLADNRRYLAFEARLPDRVLLVDGEEGSSVFGNETYFLETALQLGQDRSTRELPSFETERIVWENGEGFPDLRGFRVIVLANIGRFSDNDAARLRQYVDQGGRLLICGGERFDRRAAAPLVASGLLPAEITGVADAGRYRLASWRKEHPVFALFEDPQYGDLRQIAFRKITRLRPLGDTEVLAETQAGEPLLVESRTGDGGRVVMLASTVDAAWTDWPRERLYVPLIRQLVGYLTDQHLRETRIVDVLPTDEPGISTDADRIRVANMDPAESELARLTPAEFREALNLPEPAENADLTPEELAALAPPAGSEVPNEIWTWIAWLLLAWLLLETFLAGRVHA